MISDCSDREIVANFEMHVMHCHKHLVKCKKCNEPVKKDLLEKHEEEEHKIVGCDLCDEAMEESALEEHKVE